MVVPLIHEVQAALLHPACEILLRNGIRIVEDRALRIKNRNRGFLDGDARAAQLRGIGHVVAGVEDAGSVLYCTISVPPLCA